MDLETDVDPAGDDVDLDAAAGTPPGGEDDPDAGTPPDGDDESPEARNWRSLQEKYPGKSDDEIRAIVSAAYWDQTRALSTASKEKRDLEMRVARLEGRLEGPGSPSAPAEPPPPPPEIQELDTYITGLDQEDAEAAARQTELLKDLGESRDRAAELRALIASAKARSEEELVPVLEARLELAAQTVKSIQGSLFSTVRERKHLQWNKQRAQKEKTWLTKLHSEGQAREASEREELEESLAAIPVRVDGIITAAMSDKAYGVPADPAIREDLRDYVRDKITIDFWRIGHDVPVNRINVKTLVDQHVKKYMAGRGLAKRAVFAARSREKAAVSGSPPPAASPPNAGADGRRPPTAVSAHGTLSAGMLRGRRLLQKAGW